MRHLTLATLAIAGFSQAAFAADLPVKAASPMTAMVAAYNWTGLYIGGNVGYGWGRNESVVVNETLAGAPFVSGTWPGVGTFGARDMTGGFGGLQIGYNLQAGNIVYGVEADAQWAGIKGNSGATLPYIVAPNTISVTTNGNLDWFGTVRGRLGVAFDRSLLYVTGGVAFGRAKYSLAMTDTLGFVAAGNASSKSTGWVLGAGWEFGLAPQWTLKAEYQYLDFGSTTLGAGETFGGLPTAFAVASNATSRFHTVRLGVNYRFGH
ncbi:MAG: outer rane immunogenic protein [Alphaproteobacteria bacterium]|jgi:outer membrane immunogenic protein|nr:outer rane immunogenic protein [Alphaproteobacteria bacterium]